MGKFGDDFPNRTPRGGKGANGESNDDLSSSRAKDNFRKLTMKTKNAAMEETNVTENGSLKPTSNIATAAIALTSANKRNATKDKNESEMANQAMFAPKHTLSDTEALFLKAVETADMSMIETFLEEGVNTSAKDFLGRTALELAVEHEHIAILELLLPKAQFAQLEDALRMGVSKDNVRICEMILSHPLYTKKRRMALMGDQSFYQKEDDENTSFTPDITPLMLAAQRNNFPIIQLLIDKGATIAIPHEYFCTCTECSNQREFDSVKYSRTRLNAYRSISSPAYMALSSADPLIHAFELAKVLDNLASIEKEYSSEYLRLSQVCRTFALELYDLCRTTEEVMAILNGEEQVNTDDIGRQSHTLSVLKLAIKTKQKHFIAHSASQRQLLLLWYSGVPWLRHQKSTVTLLLLLMMILMFPVIMLSYIFWPRGRLARIMRTPCIKFYNHTISYFIFLLLILVNSSMGGNKFIDVACEPGNTQKLLAIIPSVIICIWNIGMLWTEMREVYGMGIKDYMQFWWNWMDCVVLSMYFASYVLQFITMLKISSSLETKYQEGYYYTEPTFANYFCQTRKDLCGPLACDIDLLSEANQNFSCLVKHTWESPPDQNIPDPTRVADIMFALASMISFARVAFILPASEQLGPLLVSFGLMLQDVTRVLVIMALIFASFLAGLTVLYQSYECENLSFTTLSSTAKSLFWATFLMAETNAPLIVRNTNAYSSVVPGRFLKQESDMAVTELIGYFLFGLYILANAVVLINMLIAMMSNSFQEIYDDKDVEWKFARAKFWIVYFDDENTLPPPFNIFPSLPSCVKWIHKLKNKVMSRNDFIDYNGDNFGGTSDKKVTGKLVKRYIHKKQFTEKKDDAAEELPHLITGMHDTFSKNIIRVEEDFESLRTKMETWNDSLTNELRVLKKLIKCRGFISDELQSQHSAESSNADGSTTDSNLAASKLKTQDNTDGIREEINFGLDDVSEALITSNEEETFGCLESKTLTTELDDPVRQENSVKSTVTSQSSTSHIEKDREDFLSDTKLCAEDKIPLIASTREQVKEEANLNVERKIPNNKSNTSTEDDTEKNDIPPAYLENMLDGNTTDASLSDASSVVAHGLGDLKSKIAKKKRKILPATGSKSSLISNGNDSDGSAVNPEQLKNIKSKITAKAKEMEQITGLINDGHESDGSAINPDELIRIKSKITAKVKQMEQRTDSSRKIEPDAYLNRQVTPTSLGERSETQTPQSSNQKLINQARPLSRGSKNIGLVKPSIHKTPSPPVDDSSRDLP